MLDVPYGPQWSVGGPVGHAPAWWDEAIEEIAEEVSNAFHGEFPADAALASLLDGDRKPESARP
jgi:hypothetical protein